MEAEILAPSLRQETSRADSCQRVTDRLDGLGVGLLDGVRGGAPAPWLVWNQAPTLGVPPHLGLRWCPFLFPFKSLCFTNYKSHHMHTHTDTDTQT